MEQRIQYLDSMRGATMILVVYSHVIVFLLGMQSAVNEVFISFRMPLFFFISGFLSFALYTPSLVRKRVTNRILYQLIPTAAMSGIFFLCFPVHKALSLFREFPAGYWFTYTMVEIFLFYMVLNLLFIRRGFSEKKIGICLLTAAVVCYPVREAFARIFFDTLFFGKSQIWLFLTYLPYFLFGILCRKHMSLFFRAISRWYTLAALLAAYLLLRWAAVPELSKIAMGFCAIPVLVELFRKGERFFSLAHPVGRVLSYVGKHTLEVYLLHYFAIQLVRGAVRHTPALKAWASSSSWIEFPMVFAAACLIVALCLGVARLLTYTPPLHHLLLGRCPERKWHLSLPQSMQLPFLKIKKYH